MQAQQAWAVARGQQSSVVSDLFEGQLQSSVVCGTCAATCHNFEAFQDLSLPLPDAEGLTIQVSSTVVWHSADSGDVRSIGRASASLVQSVLTHAVSHWSSQTLGFNEVTLAHQPTRPAIDCCNKRDPVVAPLGPWFSQSGTLHWNDAAPPSPDSHLSGTVAACAQTHPGVIPCMGHVGPEP